MHPLRNFAFCPVCGSPKFEVHDARAKRCGDCGFTLYHNASAATAAFVRNTRGELLVCRRAFEPARGTLDLPGGFVEPGESIEAGCRREVREETGAEVTSLRYLFSIPNTYAFSGYEVHTADAFFGAQVADETALAAADDVAVLEWVPLDKVRPEDFGLDSISQGVRRYMDTHRKA